MTFSSVQELLSHIEEHLRRRHGSYCFFFERGIERFQVAERLSDAQKQVLLRCSHSASFEERGSGGFYDYRPKGESGLKATIGWGECSHSRVLNLSAETGVVITPSYLPEEKAKPLFMRSPHFLMIEVTPCLRKATLTGSAEEFGLNNGVFHFADAPLGHEQKRGGSGARKSSVFHADAFAAKVKDIQKEILKGNAYLANLTQHFPLDEELYPPFKAFLSAALTGAKTRFSIYFKSPQLSFVSYTPECFVRVNGRSILTEPIKGTALWSELDQHQGELWGSMKESCEQNMVIDLLRNDLNAISRPGSVVVTLAKALVKAGKLAQMTSFITAELVQEFTFESLRALLPAGSVSGTPKTKVSQILQKVEDQERRYYTGTCTLVTQEEVVSTLLIRTLFNEQGGCYFGCGGGITSLSQPEAEAQEVLKKMESFL